MKGKVLLYDPNGIVMIVPITLIMMGQMNQELVQYVRVKRLDLRRYWNQNPFKEYYLGNS